MEETLILEKPKKEKMSKDTSKESIEKLKALKLTIDKIDKD